MRSRHHIPFPRERNVVLRRPPGSNYFGDLHGVFVVGRDKGEIREKKNETAVGDPKKKHGCRCCRREHNKGLHSGLKRHDNAVGPYLFQKCLYTNLVFELVKLNTF